MSFTDNGYGNGFYMPVAPAYGGGYSNGFGNGFGGDGGWWLLVLLFALGGCGNNGFGGNGNNGAFPWLVASNTNTDNLLNAGFNQAATAGQLNSIQNAVTNGFSSAEVAACNRAMDSMQTQYTNQIAGLERSFAAQTANTAALTGLGNQLSDCCCENRLATANLSALVQSENCADREALSNGIRDINTTVNAVGQRILDQLCNDKIDEKNDRIRSLETQVTMQNLAASQAAQTAALVADNSAQTQYIVNRVAPYPIPAYITGNPYGCNNFGFGNFGYGFNGYNNGFGAVGFGNGTF